MNVRCSRRRKKSTDEVERSNGYIEASRRRRNRYEEKVERETIKDIKDCNDIVDFEDIADIKVTEEENENIEKDFLITEEDTKIIVHLWTYIKYISNEFNIYQIRSCEDNKRIRIEINIAKKVSVSELKHLLLEHIETIGTEKSELPKKVIFNTLVSKHKENLVEQ